MLSVFCNERQKRLRLRDFGIVGTPEVDRKGGFCTPFRDPSPLGMITSVSHRGPWRALGSRAVPVRPKNNRGLSLDMQSNYVEMHTVETLLYGLYR